MNHRNIFPSSTSSSSQSSMASAGAAGGGLMRYASAPSSIISTAVDSVIGNRNHHFLFPSSEAESVASATPNLNHPFLAGKNVENHHKAAEAGNNKDGARNNAREVRGSGGGYGFPIGGSGPSNLVRHTSSPAHFLNHLAASASAGRGGDAGFSITNGVGSYNHNKDLSENNGRGIARLNSQLSFTHKEFLSRISEENEGIGDGVVDAENNNNNNRRNPANHSFGGSSSNAFGIGSWDENSNQITFSSSSNKRAKTVGGGNNNLGAMEPHQFQFSMSHVLLPMDMPMDKLLHVPQDSVPCKTRAKRGCATHPRSIAERERRTRISGKLKKLQDLVPNMDKQTSYADMLDLALQHIRSLQSQVEKLNEELDSCTCGCKRTEGS